MSHLFKIEGKVVFPNPETLLISPFKDIWERDTSEGKANALEDLAYAEFMVSMLKTNPYRQYPPGKKEEVIIEAVITRKNWTPDELVTKAMHEIVDMQRKGSTTYNYYMSAKNATEKLSRFFNEVDITEVNPKTMNPIYKPRDITSALNDVVQSAQNGNGEIDLKEFKKFMMQLE